MNNWINANKIKLYSCSEAFARECNLQLVEAIPVSALEELFSKDGEQLAREMYPDVVGIGYGINSAKRSGFFEAYNIQEVKIAELKKEVEELREPMRLGQLRDLINAYLKEEISMSKFLEVINKKSKL